jgi:D-cysteine desulfhydrase
MSIPSGSKIGINLSKARLQSLDDFDISRPDIKLDVLRLDLIHRLVSGNKYFKLKYHIEKAFAENKKGILSFGGAYSNHLVATAYTCAYHGLRSVGIVRGEEPTLLSPALTDAKAYGMELRFISRDRYKDRDTGLINEPDFLLVNEGGQSEEGIRGASEIMNLVSPKRYTHIACSIGTGTMITGIINNSSKEQKILGFSSLKISNEQDNELSAFISNSSTQNNYSIFYQYHFGGYAKKNNELLEFMNQFYTKWNIPTDFVYTAKLFYGITDLVKQGYFTEASSILVIHSGGLQGNRSLEKGVLKF